MREPSGRTTLYRLFAEDGDLLYVGIAGNPGRRFDQHDGEKPWWGDVARTELQHFAERAEARSAEMRAIARELPLFNRADRPAGAYWIDDLRPATAARYPDRCDRCQAADRIDWGRPDTWVHHPVRALVENGWLTGYYRCRACGFTWTCGYALAPSLVA